MHGAAERSLYGAWWIVAPLVLVLAVLGACGGDDADEVSGEPVEVRGEVVQVESVRLFAVAPTDGGDPVAVFNAMGEPEPEVGDVVFVEGTMRPLAGSRMNDDGFELDFEPFSDEPYQQGVVADSVELVDEGEGGG